MAHAFDDLAEGIRYQAVVIDDKDIGHCGPVPGPDYIGGFPSKSNPRNPGM